MTTLLLIVILLIALVLAAQLVRLGHGPSRVPETTELEQEFARLDRYGPMIQSFTGSQGREKGSRRLMRQFLCEIREDFSRAWAICRLLAPVSSDPEFGTMLAKQLVLFNSLHTLVWLRCWTGAYSYAGSDAEKLVDAVRSLRETSNSILETVRAQAFESAGI